MWTKKTKTLLKSTSKKIRIICTFQQRNEFYKINVYFCIQNDSLLSMCENHNFA